MNTETLKDTVKDTVANAADSVKTTAASAYDAARTATQKVASDIKSHASDTAGAALDTAAARIDAAKDKLVDGADRVEEKLRDAAQSSDAADMQARVFGSLADGVAAATDRLRDRSLTDLAQDVKSLARRHPGAFVAGAAVVGFAAVRFIRASARNAQLARSVTEADLRSSYSGNGPRS